MDSAPPTAAAVAAADPLAESRARHKDLATTLGSLVGLTDPAVCGARTRLEDEHKHLGEQLHCALPVRQQLRAATTQLGKSLTVLAGLQEEVQALDLVLDDRRIGGVSILISTLKQNQLV